jgi:hypothetical protein
MSSVRPALIAVGLLGGCSYFTVGDGMFAVNGTLPASPRSCEVLLLSDRNEEVPFTRRKVQGQFRADFTVAPTARVYRVAIECDSTMRTITTVRYGTEVKPGQEVALGAIAL